ncbi:hypothetical protein BSPLISOX_2507 [uncultured Gammaproteobacteria bacterium]|nr:hypothetical protein [uncultured Gammaproteobacteria bacterium]CAC9479375.1 hypothetical protein [uncultured Gammaproteobacteria bacterium]VVH66680.1 hypothetical protein BSPLISOX_2507 [uncultured Gammaproteobacteria bacterium]
MNKKKIMFVDFCNGSWFDKEINEWIDFTLKDGLSTEWDGYSSRHRRHCDKVYDILDKFTFGYKEEERLIKKYPGLSKHFERITVLNNNDDINYDNGYARLMMVKYHHLTWFDKVKYEVKIVKEYCLNSSNFDFGLILHFCFLFLLLPLIYNFYETISYLFWISLIFLTAYSYERIKEHLL